MCHGNWTDTHLVIIQCLTGYHNALVCKSRVTHLFGRGRIIVLLIRSKWPVNIDNNIIVVCNIHSDTEEQAVAIKYMCRVTALLLYLHVHMIECSIWEREKSWI